MNWLRKAEACDLHLSFSDHSGHDCDVCAGTTALGAVHTGDDDVCDRSDPYQKAVENRARNEEEQGGPLMIVLAEEKDRQQVREMWKICFPQEDPGYIDYYFKSVWDPASCYVVKEDDRIVSSLCRHTHPVTFHGRVLSASMISGVCTLPSYQGKGYMHQLMNVTVDACAHSELMTFIRAKDPALYEPFGFRAGMYRTGWMVQRQDVKRVPSFGCAYDVQALDMLKVYSAYIRRFSGFYCRDLKDFVRYRNEIAAQGGKIIGYYNGQDRIDGYAALTMQGSDLYIDELVYLDSVALAKLLNACLQERPRVHFNVSKAENFTPLFPNAKHHDYIGTMVRINDYELFNKLYQSQASNVKEALAVSRRPLNQNEAF